MGQADKPTNYDHSLDGLTPDWKNGKMPNPGLNATKDFGSAARSVLKESRGYMSKIDGTKAAQAARPDNPNAVPLPLGRTPADFKASQIPNTGPKFTREGDLTAHDVKRPKTSASMIFHGEQNKNRSI